MNETNKTIELNELLKDVKAMIPALLWLVVFACVFFSVIGLIFSINVARWISIGFLSSQLSLAILVIAALVVTIICLSKKA